MIATINKILLDLGSLKINDTVIDNLKELGYTPETLIEDIKIHGYKHNAAPAVYVGTVSKYHSNDITGLWVDLSTFDSEQQFLRFCMAIHADIHNPVLMYQDIQNLLDALYNQYCLDFEQIELYCELIKDFSEIAILDYYECFGDDAKLDDFVDKYFGFELSDYDFGYNILTEYNPDFYRQLEQFGMEDYFDYQKFGETLLATDFVRGSYGSIFNNY